MKRFRILIPVLLSVMVLMLVAGVASPEERLHSFSLENGMKVVLVPSRATPVIALQIWVNVGSTDEREDEAGMCHFIEHMIFKGTEKRKVGEIAREIESLGGSVNAYTSYDYTVYHITLASRFADTGLDILTDVLQHSTFDAKELEREREVVLEEIRMGEDDPSRRIFKQTMAALYRNHPYGRPVIGYEKTVKAITQEQMVSFFRKWYGSNRMLFMIVGEFDPPEMEKRVREVSKGFRRSSEPDVRRLVEPEPTAVRTAFSSGAFKETYLQIALPIPSARDEDTPCLDAISQILGGGEASRLVQKVKLEKGLVHTVSASTFTPRDPGAFFVEATLPSENLEKALAAIEEEILRLYREGVTAEELYRVKVGLESDLIYGRQTVQGLAQKLGYYELTTGDVQFEKEYLRRVALLQSEDIQRAVKTYLRPSRSVVSLLMPPEKLQGGQDASVKSLFERLEAGFSLPETREEAVFAKRTLDNGIRLIVKENRSLPIVTLQASFLGGLRFEEEGNNGINQFIAVMLTKGTRNRSSLEIAKKVEGMAGSLNGFSGYNSFGLTFTFLSEHFDEAFRLFSEVLRHPAFDPGEMEKRRRTILATIRQQEDDLDRLVFKLFRKTLYEKHPYRMDSLGVPATVGRLTQKDLTEYYQRFAVPENMVLTVVGDVEAEQVMTAAQNGFGDLRKGKFVPPSIPPEPPLSTQRTSEVYEEKEQSHFVLGFLGPTLESKDRCALEVLDAALSGMGGRLFYELRDKESLAYALSFFVRPNLDRGFMGVYMGTRPDKLEAAIKAVIRELGKVKEEGLTEDEVERAKRYLIGNFEIGLQTNGAQATQIAADELYGLGFDYFQKYPEMIQKVTKEDVQRVARSYIDLEHYALAIIRPPVGKKE
jgi:zinc protease